jgi:hypothetical protein
VRAQAGRFGEQRHKMVRRHPGNLGHGHHANVCAIVRVDVVDDSGYTSLANVRILSLFAYPPQRANNSARTLVKCSGFGQFFRKIGLKNR